MSFPLGDRLETIPPPDASGVSCALALSVFQANPDQVLLGKAGAPLPVRVPEKR